MILDNDKRKYMNDPASIVELVKSEIKDCRFHADCLALKVKQFRKYDKILNVFLAVTSSTSIASWAIWSSLAKVWGCIIALSQIISALRPYFPYSKHVHTLNTKCYKQETLFLELDNLWFCLKDGSISEGDAKIRLNHIKQQLRENMFFDDDDGFEFSDAIQEQAKIMTADTLKMKFNITD